MEVTNTLKYIEMFPDIEISIIKLITDQYMYEEVIIQHLIELSNTLDEKKGNTKLELESNKKNVINNNVNTGQVKTNRSSFLTRLRSSSSRSINYAKLNDE